MLGTEPRLIEEYVSSGQVRLQFWHILDHGNASLRASAAAECAGEQGAFWAMHDVLFANQDQLWSGDYDVLTNLAGQTGIDTETFRQCLTSGEKQQYVSKINTQVKARGVRIRPTFEINNQRIQGSPPLDQWRQLLDGML